MSEFKFRHYPELDGFRGLAVLLVIIGHVSYFSLGVDSHLASLGVLLFFVLSGFLITGVLLNEKDARGRISLANFLSVPNSPPGAGAADLSRRGYSFDLLRRDRRCSLVRGRHRSSVHGEYRRARVAGWPPLELIAGGAVLRDAAVVGSEDSDPAAAVHSPDKPRAPIADKQF
jgi:hypothetical protein